MKQPPAPYIRVAAGPVGPLARRLTGARGVVLLALLITLALLGLSLLAASESAATSRQRAREQELLFVGDQYRQAIERYYYAAPPGTPRLLPQNTEQLLLDDRYPQPLQHLRRPYADPFEGGDWTWIRLGDRLAGLHSNARTAPLKRANFRPPYTGFATASDVSQWVFVFKPPAPATVGRPIPPTAPRTN
jgi:type II secretory pathway pseudopilin PulG